MAHAMASAAARYNGLHTNYLALLSRVKALSVDHILASLRGSLATITS